MSFSCQTTQHACYLLCRFSTALIRQKYVQRVTLKKRYLLNQKAAVWRKTNCGTLSRRSSFYFFIQLCTCIWGLSYRIRLSEAVLPANLEFRDSVRHNSVKMPLRYFLSSNIINLLLFCNKEKPFWKFYWVVSHHKKINLRN